MGVGYKYIKNYKFSGPAYKKIKKLPQTLVTGSVFVIFYRC